MTMRPIHSSRSGGLNFSVDKAVDVACTLVSYAAETAVGGATRSVSRAARRFLSSVTPTFMQNIASNLSNAFDASSLSTRYLRAKFSQKISLLDLVYAQKEDQQKIAELSEICSPPPVAAIEQMKELRNLVASNVCNVYDQAVTYQPSTWGNGQTCWYNPLTWGNNETLRKEMRTGYESVYGEALEFDPVLLLRDHAHRQEQVDNGSATGVAVASASLDAQTTVASCTKTFPHMTAQQKFDTERARVSALFTQRKQKVQGLESSLTANIQALENRNNQSQTRLNASLEMANTLLDEINTAKIKERAPYSDNLRVFLDGDPIDGTYYVIERRDGGGLSENSPFTAAQAVALLSGTKPGTVIYARQEGPGFSQILPSKKAPEIKAAPYWAYKLEATELAKVTHLDNSDFTPGSRIALRAGADGPMVANGKDNKLEKNDDVRTAAILREQALRSMEFLTRKYIDGTIDDLPIKEYQALITSIDVLKNSDFTSQLSNFFGLFTQTIDDDKIYTEMENFFDSSEKKSVSLRNRIHQRALVNEEAAAIEEVTSIRYWQGVADPSLISPGGNKVALAFKKLRDHLGSSPLLKTGLGGLSNLSSIGKDVTKLRTKAATIRQEMVSKTTITDGLAAANAHLKEFYITAQKVQLAIRNSALKKVLEKELKEDQQIILGNFKLQELDQAIATCIQEIEEGYQEVVTHIPEDGLSNALESFKQRRSAYANGQVEGQEAFINTYMNQLT